jgi:hypothetical protein
MRPELVEGRRSSHQERSRDCRNAFSATGQAKAICGGRRKTDRSANSFAHRELGLSTARCEPGTVTDQLDGNIGNVKAGRSYPGSSFGQKGCTWGIGPLRVGGPVVAAKITEPGGAQQRITGCMGDDITIRVTLRT